VLNTQEAGLLPPAEPHAQTDSAKQNYVKIWIAIVAVLLVAARWGTGYALRPALEPTQAVAPSEPVPADKSEAGDAPADDVSPACSRKRGSEGRGG